MSIFCQPHLTLYLQLIENTAIKTKRNLKRGFDEDLLNDLVRRENFQKLQKYQHNNLEYLCINSFQEDSAAFEPLF